MPTIQESTKSASPLNAVLEAGIDTLDQNQVIEFTLYIRTVLPLDGFVFWVKADLLAASALANAFTANAVTPNQSAVIATPAAIFRAAGSLHYSTNVEQNEDQTFARRQVIFTAEEEINDLAEINPNTMWIGEFEGVQFAFSQRQPFYRQAGIFHYVGDAIYPDMQSQIISPLAGFNNRALVVSNSLPIWLAFGMMAPKPWEAPRELFPLYPSFAVPPNIAPPWASVHIEPEETEAFGSAPYRDRNSSHFQLARDVVRITTYGIRNAAALDFQDAVNSFSTTSLPSVIGILNMPIFADEKKKQRELNILAMKKTITFEVSYYQTRINAFSRQLIRDVIPNFDVGALAS